MSKLLKSYMDFTGGLNTDAAPDNILDNELVAVDNADLSERGGFSRRFGEERLNESSYEFPVEQIIEWPRDRGGETLLAIVGTSLGYNQLCVVNEDDEYSLTPIINVGDCRRIAYFYYKDHLYLNTGTAYWVFDGKEAKPIVQDEAPDELTLEAMSIPDTAPTATLNHGSIPPGTTAPYIKGDTHYYRVSFIDKNGIELPAGKPIEITVDEDSASVTLSNIPIGPVGTKKRVIYHRAVQGKPEPGIIRRSFMTDEKKYYTEKTLNNNTATTTDLVSNDVVLSFNSTYKNPIKPGDYRCAYTFVSKEGFESESSPVETIKVGDGEVIKWGIEDHDPEEIMLIRLYRSNVDEEVLRFMDFIEAGETEYLDYRPLPSSDEDKEKRTEEVLKKIEDITGETEGLWVDTTPTVGDIMTAVNNLVVVRKCTFSCYHPKSMRMFFTGNPEDPSAVYFSEIGNPTKVINTSVIYPTTGDGPAVGINTFGDAVIVHYENNSMWKWAGIDPSDDAVWLEVPSGTSAIAPGTINHTPNSLSFLGRGAWIAMNPVVLHYSTGMQPGEEVVRNIAKKKVERLIREMEHPHQAVSVFDSKNQRSLMAYTSKGAVRNNYILVYDWTLGAFTRYTGIQANDMIERLNGDILIATNGYILKLSENYLHADGSPVAMRTLTKQYTLDYPYHRKRITRLFATLANPEKQDTEVTFRVYVDGIEVAEMIETTLYDSFVWGEEWGSRWGSQELITTRTKVSASGHRIQLEIENTEYDKEGNPEDLPCIVYGIAFEFRPSRAKGTRL